jgi:alpha-L-fucosidase
LNIGQEPTGKFPEESINKLKELAGWMSTNEESIRSTGQAEYTSPEGGFYTQKDKVIYLYLTTQPMGDIILPELDGKIDSINNLRTGDEVAQITHWGFELLQENEIRIRPLNCKADDVLKIILT